MNLTLDNKNIDKNKEMNLFLNSNRTSGDNFSHVSMGEKKGKYYMSRDNIYDLFTLCSERKGVEGIAEIPQEYSMLRMDFDFEQEGIIPRELFDMETFINHIKDIQNFLKQTIINFKRKQLDCCILTKDPYLKDNKTIKHGLHLQFPNIFVNKNDFAKVEEKFKHLEGFDCGMASKPWLLYGQSKGLGKGTYKPFLVINHKGNSIEPKDYFVNYKVYNVSERVIKYTIDTVENYYPNIFSVLPLGRCDEMVVYLKYIDNEDLIVRENTVYDDCDEEVQEYENEIREVVDLFNGENDNSFSVGNWNNNFLSLQRKKSSYCPTTGYRIHDNISSYVTINKEKGNVYVGCYCNEHKPVFIGMYKEVIKEKSKTIQREMCINLDCDEASKIYTPSKGKKHFGKTYTQIIEDDMEFVEWVINNNIKPHSKTFSTILGREYDETNNFIKLDYIKPDETINLPNIGSYVPRLEKADVVCMRSCMMTFKTQNLRELMTLYPRILIVSFRVSLEDEYMNTFKNDNFELYSDFKGLITTDRLVCQIDSLYKVRGEFDLLILDEFVYTMDHLHSFVKRKEKVWDSLNQYISFTNKIIVCDALLDNKTIKLFENNNRSTWIVENKWESFKSKKVNYIDFTTLSSTIKYVTEQLEIWGSLYIPTNSKTLADKLFLYLSNTGINVGMDSSESDPTPSDEWKNYDVFISTPTNVAGVSCNDEFGKTIAYFTSSSCSASMGSQMLFRVRNTKSDTYDIIIKSTTMGISYPINIPEIKKWIYGKEDLIINSGLKINYIRNKIIEDDYFENYVEYIKKENMSKVIFKQVLRGILKVHGLVEEKVEIVKENTEDEKKELDAIKVTTKILYDEDKKLTRENVCNAVKINDDEFKEIDDKYRKTNDEKLSIRRYRLDKTYGYDIELTEDFVNTFEKIIPQYKNLQTMNTDKNNIQDYLETIINEYEKEHKKDFNTNRLHENRNNLKIWTADNIIKVLGFDNVFDSKTVQGFPYEKARKFLEERGSDISLLFGCNNENNWSNMKLIKITKDMNNNQIVESTKTNTTRRKIVSEFLNNRLKSVCNIGVKNKYKGKDSKKEEYIIQGLDIWKQGKLDILPNEKANELFRNKNFKTLIRKKQVGSKVWKCISEVVQNDILVK